MNETNVKTGNLADTTAGMAGDAVTAAIDAIIETRKSRINAERLGWRKPRKNLWASDLSPCVRYHFYNNKKWQEKQVPDGEAVAKINNGKEVEKTVVRELHELGRQVGFEVTGQQEYFQIECDGQVVISGKMEGQLEFSRPVRCRIPYEIKHMNANGWGTMRVTDDLLKRSYYKKYINQVNMYLHAKNREAAILIIESEGRWKLMPVYYDQGIAERDCQIAVLACKAIAADKLPERIHYRDDVCGICNFSHICLPDQEGVKPEFVSSDMIDKIDRHQELKPLASEYNAINEELNTLSEGQPKLIVGTKYMITGKWIPKTRIKKELIPDADLPKYQEEYQSWRKEIIQLEKEREIAPAEAIKKSIKGDTDGQRPAAAGAATDGTIKRKNATKADNRKGAKAVNKGSRPGTTRPRKADAPEAHAGRVEQQGILPLPDKGRRPGDAAPFAKQGNKRAKNVR